MTAMDAFALVHQIPLRGAIADGDNSKYEKEDNVPRGACLMDY
jgi:hypothetical protein